MSEYIHQFNKKISALKLDIFKKDIVFTISMILALASCFAYAPKLEYINFKVLFSLLNLMLVIKAFEELQVLDKVSIGIVNKCSDYRKVSLILILLCFFSSMLITNDVALITFVPLTLIISKKTKKTMMNTIIFQTLAANIGSSLTPMGNPQNLFIFSYYGLTPAKFIAAVGLFVLFGGVWLYVLNGRIKKYSIDIELTSINLRNKREVLVWSAVFCIITASILGAVSYKLTFIITIFTVLVFNNRLILKIDYLLLVTFVCFFVFIGNISNIAAVYTYMSSHLKSEASVYLGSILSSQFISNVPSSILLSRFTSNWRALLLGVNIGGMGTIIASLASVISYKLFIGENAEQAKSYMIKFTIYNFASLIFLGAVGFFFLKL